MMSHMRIRSTRVVEWPLWVLGRFAGGKNGFFCGLSIFLLSWSARWKEDVNALVDRDYLFIWLERERKGETRRVCSSGSGMDKDKLIVNRSLLCVNRCLWCVIRSLLCADGSLLCINRSLWCVHISFWCVIRSCLCVKGSLLCANGTLLCVNSSFLCVIGSLLRVKIIGNLHKQNHNVFDSHSLRKWKMEKKN